VKLDCGHEVAEGGVAYQQDWRHIEVAGKTATVKDEVRVVCGPCADREAAR
jgi:hypothetical protein